MQRIHLSPSPSRSMHIAHAVQCYRPINAVIKLNKLQTTRKIIKIEWNALFESVQMKTLSICKNPRAKFNAPKTEHISAAICQKCK